MKAKQKKQAAKGEPDGGDEADAESAGLNTPQPSAPAPAPDAAGIGAGAADAVKSPSKAAWSDIAADKTGEAAGAGAGAAGEADAKAAVESGPATADVAGHRVPADWLLTAEDEKVPERKALKQLRLEAAER